MSKCKVCFIVSNLKQGGAERQLVELIKRLDSSKYEITLCLYDMDKVFYDELYSLDNIRIVQRQSESKFKLLDLFKRARFIRDFLQTNEFDILHTLLFHNGLNVRLYAPLKYKNRILYSIRNSFDLFLQPKKKWKLILEKYFLKSSFVVCNTVYSADKFKSVVDEAFTHKISAIYNGYDENLFKPQDKQLNKKFVVGMLGRQTYQKNHIQAIKVALDMDDEIEIHIYGDRGDQSEKLSEIVDANKSKGKVFLHPPHSDVTKLYNSFDAFLLTSHYEGCPNVLFEAMLCKVPTIISKGANTDNFVVDNVNGYLYDGSEEELIAKLRTCMNANNNNIVENAYVYVTDNFTLNAMVRSYCNLYDDILKNS